MIVGIILAAGESTRMGTPKQLLPWGKTTVLQQVIDNTRGSLLDTTLLVLGYSADDIMGKIRVSSRTRILVNHDFRAGMSSSIKRGIEDSPAGVEAFMVLLGDQPLIGTGIIDKLIGSYHLGRRGIVIPVCDGQRGHPVIFDSRYREELLTISDQGAREVINRHTQDVFEVPVDNPDILRDIDTLRDYREATRKLENRND